MEKISNKLAKRLLEENPDINELDEIRFGIELILTQTILLLMILIIGVVSNSLSATIIYLVVLFLLRAGMVTMLIVFLNAHLLQLAFI